MPVWTPRQLRHTRATQIRHEFGSIEAAKAVLGHTDTRVTEIYAERDLKLAADVMRRIGECVGCDGCGGLGEDMTVLVPPHPHPSE